MGNQIFEESHSPKIKMSDREESPVAEVPEAEEVEVSGDAASKGQMSVLDALKGVLKLALMHDGLARGLRSLQGPRSPSSSRLRLERVLRGGGIQEAGHCALLRTQDPLKVPDGKQLGEWAGLCVLDREGNARKVVNCSCVVVKDWGEESQERSILLNYFNTEQ